MASLPELLQAKVGRNLSASYDKELKTLPSTLERPEFVRRFAEIYEHSPWVAERAYDAGIGTQHDTVEGLSTALAKAVDISTVAEKLTLLRQYPKLASNITPIDELTVDSASEQASAGLDKCTAIELARFATLNDQYETKFGFPFIMAVKNKSKDAILDAFLLRIDNQQEAEFLTAIKEVHAIAKIRIESMG